MAGSGDERPKADSVALESALVELASMSALKYAHEAPEILPHWATHLPMAYDWVYDDSESLMSRGMGQSDEQRLHEWLSAVARDWIAYSHMQMWKTYEMVVGSVALLNGGHVAAASAPARSAMESTIALTALVGRWLELAQGLRSGQSGAPELENFAQTLEAAIWGRKSALRQVEARNILTLKDWLLKRVTDPDTVGVLDDVYSQLCDVVHPSATGHQVWWGDVADLGDSNARLVPLRYGKPGTLTTGIAELVLWAIGWSTAWSIRSFANGVDAGHAVLSASVD